MVVSSVLEVRMRLFVHSEGYSLALVVSSLRLHFQCSRKETHYSSSAVLVSVSLGAVCFHLLVAVSRLAQLLPGRLCGPAFP